MGWSLIIKLLAHENRFGRVGLAFHVVYVIELSHNGRSSGWVGLSNDFTSYFRVSGGEYSHNEQYGD